MCKDQIADIINLLEDIRQKPRKWLHSGDHAIVDFIGGFNAAMAFTAVYRDYLTANAHVLKERGWETSSRHVWYDLTPLAPPNFQSNAACPLDSAPLF